jgi:hypothetical protein
LRLPVVERRYPSFSSTLKTKGTTCERYALSVLYLRPQTAELYGTCGKQDREQEACQSYRFFRCRGYN